MAEAKTLIRIMNTDLDGNLQVYKALTKIRGISFMFSNAVCNLLNIEKTKKVGTISEQDIEKIESLVKHPDKFPSWLLNRRNDVDTGINKHLSGTDIKFNVENDIKMMKKIKSYKGMRHAYGLPVRGQRTRGNFRHGKAVGVQKKAIAAAKPALTKEEQKKKDKK